MWLTEQAVTLRQSPEMVAERIRQAVAIHDVPEY